MMVFSAAIIVFLLLIIAYLLGKQSRHTPAKPKLWDGPEPTLQERQDNWQWMVEYFKKYPESPIKDAYPQLHQIAIASKRYDELNELRNAGMIDEIDYQIELEKILPLISLSELPS